MHCTKPHILDPEACVYIYFYFFLIAQGQLRICTVVTAHTSEVLKN